MITLYKLKYANLSLFNDTLLIKSTIRNLKELNIFNGIPDNFIICLNEESRYLYQLIESNANWNINCSKDICTHYHYYDNSGEIFFTDSDNCPQDYENLISEEKECVNNCTEYSEYQYEFRYGCYNSCPNIPNFNLTFSDDNKYKCEILCTKESPFEIVQEQNCHKNCGIFNLHQGKCILNYQGEDIENIMLHNILLNINSNTDINEYIDQNDYIEFNMSQASFIIANTEYIKKETKFNISQLNECEKSLKNIYTIAPNESLYILIVNTFKEEMNNKKAVFEIYYPNQISKHLTKSDLSLCINTIQNSIINCSSYSIESILNDSCISCKSDYYPIYEEQNLYNNQFKKC